MSEWAKDSAERVGWTFVEAAVGGVGGEALAVAVIGGDVSVLRASAVAGLTAVLSWVKTLAARKVGDPANGSTRRIPKLAAHPATEFVDWPDDR